MAAVVGGAAGLVSGAAALDERIETIDGWTMALDRQLEVTGAPDVEVDRGDGGPGKKKSTWLRGR